jgi:hypothetical protein
LHIFKNANLHNLLQKGLREVCPHRILRHLPLFLNQRIEKHTAIMLALHCAIFVFHTIIYLEENIKLQDSQEDLL